MVIGNDHYSPIGRKALNNNVGIADSGLYLQSGYCYAGDNARILLFTGTQVGEI